MVSVAIIDVIGLTYDGDTLKKRGLGGSESAVILMSKELAKLGFDVTVFNNCIDREAQEGVYDGVKYIDLTRLQQFNDYTFDVVISSRTVFPFLKERDWAQFNYRFDMSLFANIKKNAKYKAVWLHDTFCQGDHLVEQMVVDGDIDDIYTLSDFHTSYISTCNHGNKRMLEVLKRKIFQTRNGAVLYPGEVNIAGKDRNLFVYNASVTKGMLPLVKNVWPIVKRHIPGAKLKVIGGYYRFRENAAPDEQEKTWREMVADPQYAAMDIEFTGIIKQSEIAEILKQASFMIYPPEFPETFGISSLESLLYNTPLLTSRFGALEETAVEQCSYFTDYPIVPNSLYPFIDVSKQTALFAQMVINAYNNPYLHQQKMYMCNIVKGIHGWDSVALQWKQHIFGRLGLYLPVEEYRKVSYINSRVREVFGRRFSNVDDVYIPRKSEQQKIVVVTPMYNAAEWIERCIESVASQDYDNWEMFIIDDCSPDNGYEVAVAAAERIGRGRVKVFRNDVNRGAVYNHVSTIRAHCSSEDIIMLIDGDDSLVANSQIFQKYNNLYDGTTEFTYGSCWSMVDNIPLVAQPYPEKVKQDRSYRDYRFNWNMPYTHLRTFKKYLIEGVDDSNFQDDDGKWFKAGGDGAVFYTLIERANPEGVVCIQDIVYNYNDTHGLNDYKVNGDEQTKNANLILSRKGGAKTAARPKGQFSAVIPTMWRCPELFEQLLNNLNQHQLVDEIIIINNDVVKTPDWGVLSSSKIRMLNQAENIKVNPAWNLGASMSTNDYIAIINDDIIFDVNAFERVRDVLDVDSIGVVGTIAGEAEFNQPVNDKMKIQFMEWTPGFNLHGFGQLMFFRKDHWVPIPQGFDIYFGDDAIIHNQLMAHRKVYMMYDIYQQSPRAATTSDTSIVGDAYTEDKKVFDAWFYANPIKQLQQPTPVKAKQPMKHILIAIPTNKYIEPETMKSIYDLEVPEGYKTHFQYFFGYQVDQIRNLIAHWAERYDYLFAVDSDMSFAPDTLKKLLSHDVDVVSGLYIQRKPGQHILEIYRNGRNVPYGDVKGKGLVEVDGCGFGCVLVKSNVIRTIGYPQFVYRSALDHKDTFSEDTYFCLKAKEKGFRIWADTTIKCGHHGASTFYIDDNIPAAPTAISYDEYIRRLSDQRMMPAQHVDYLKGLSNTVQPTVIYDIGSSVLHWSREAVNFWPKAQFFMFEAMSEVEPLYKQFGINYNIDVLSSEDGKQVTFYCNPEHPGGNSYFAENEQLVTNMPPRMEQKRITKTLDTVVASRGWPLPDMIKMDIRGAELDVLKGASETLANCKDIILESQKVEYNKGAPLRDEVIVYVESLGFKLVGNGPFCDNGPDGDYHFRRV